MTVAVVVCPGVRERREREVVLAGVDGDLRDGELRVRTGPLALTSLLRQVDGTGEESEGEIVEAQAGSSPSRGSRGRRARSHRGAWPGRREREPGRACLRRGSCPQRLPPAFAGSEGTAEQRVGLADERCSPIHRFAVCALGLACIGFLGHRSALSTKPASAWLALDCGAPRGLSSSRPSLRGTHMGSGIAAVT